MSKKTSAILTSIVNGEKVRCTVEASQKVLRMPPWTRLFLGSFGQLAKGRLGGDLRILAAMVDCAEGELVPRTCAELAVSTGMTPQGALLCLKRLAEAGVIEIEGSSRARRYRLSPHFFFKGGDEDAYSDACKRSRFRMVKR